MEIMHQEVKRFRWWSTEKVFLSSHFLLFGLRRIEILRDKETNFVNQGIDTSIFYARN